MTRRARLLYRALLRFAPASLRERFGADMEDLFSHRLSAAGSESRRAWVWLRAVVDVLGHAVLERLRPASGRTRGEDGMGAKMQDLGWAVRTLGRSPRFTALAAVTLAMGIGASTATFSVVDTVLFEAPPWREPARLVAIWPETNFNLSMVREAVASMPAIEAATGVSGWSLTLVGEGEPLEVRANRVSPNHFRVLGVQPALGRAFRDEEGLPGRGDVVILSHDFWLRVFGGDAGVVGRTLRLSGADADTHTVVGVMGPDFRPVTGHPEVWVPMTLDPATALEADDTWYVNQRVARLAPGATLQQARAQVARFARTIGERLPHHYDPDEVHAATVEPYGAYMVRGLGPVLWVALGAVSLVLLIACANVANLLLARGEARGRDLAIRAALGAARGRVMRMLLAESALLGLLGGALGVLLSYGLVRVVVMTAPTDFPRIGEVGMSGTLLLYAVVVTLAATVLAGLVPALRVGRVDATASLGGATRAASARRTSRTTLALVGIEVALAVMVTVGSGLMIRSLVRLTSVDVGLDDREVLAMRVSPPEGRYAGHDAQLAYYAQVMDRLRAVPSVVSAGAIHLLPGTRDNWSFPTWPEGVDVPEGTAVPTVNFRVTSPGYFGTVGLRPLRGRLLLDTDDATAERVMVVNQAFVDRFWPGLDPLGRAVRTLRSADEPYRVVGVVGNVRQHGLAHEAVPEMYLTPAQWPWAVGLWLLARVRPSDAPLAGAAALQDAIWSVDADVPITGMQELGRVFERSAATTRFLTVVLGSFGGMALLLGAIGVFGVTSYAVARRVPEFGVRLALGSTRRRVLGGALLTCAAPIGIGLVAGLAGAAALSGALRSALYGIEPSDPGTFALVAGTLLVVALFASLLPAWRASRLDPVHVLGAD